jgi:hypothetical protein
MIQFKPYSRRLHRNAKAVSPAISTVILTGTIVALLSVAVVFVNNFLWARLAESDFNSAKQFMQTIGLHIDDVAWTVGRKATVRYSSAYGNVDFLPSALNYTVYVKTQGSGNYQFFASYKVGILLFNVDVSRFSLYDGYYELIYPVTVENLTITGTSAPVARVFGVEKLTPPMSNGSFVRVVIAPSVRLLFSNITEQSGSTIYTRLYLPVLVRGDVQGSSQSVTLTGTSIAANTIDRVTSIKVTVDFPDNTSQQGFDASFFHFPSLTQVIDVPLGYSDSVLELYSGDVKVELGVHA